MAFSPVTPNTVAESVMVLLAVRPAPLWDKVTGYINPGSCIRRRSLTGMLLAPLKGLTKVVSHQWSAGAGSGIVVVDQSCFEVNPYT